MQNIAEFCSVVSAKMLISAEPKRKEKGRESFLFLFWGEIMATNKPRRSDHTWAKSAYEKAKKVIYGSQSNCAICGRAVDFDKKFPDPWSATLDHIIPVSKGGAPAALENLQLAHLQCNRIKSSKMFAPQMKEKAVDNRDLPLSVDWSKIGGA